MATRLNLDADKNKLIQQNTRCENLKNEAQLMRSKYAALMDAN